MAELQQVRFKKMVFGVGGAWRMDGLFPCHFCCLESLLRLTESKERFARVRLFRLLEVSPDRSSPQSVHALNMFPQTAHVETIAALRQE